eukprot:TRINITY_DN16614_c0_g1_i1.p1 TRINITY_DN16614_c0_g1~~TRINITY_DN16614_c0_g1_i1.p1  ORF type:complete len:372 (-),score=79.07 TRINITY_DN16614_c0_g1_i1:63-1178(-)
MESVLRENTSPRQQTVVEDGSDASTKESLETVEETSKTSVASKPRTERLDYRDKVILAPMVRVGTLPMRLLALNYGADIVYSEEIIDRKLMECKRIYNSRLDTVEFYHKGEQLVYQTCSKDTPTVIQLGAANAEGALLAANVVVGDVDAIDINMGCPVHFSISGGMGSALLKKPQTIHEILTTLVRNMPETKAVTCKVRLLDTIPETVDLLRMIERTGVAAVGVHARRVPDRPRFKARWDELSQTLSAASLSIPVIANGDLFQREDIQRMKEEIPGCSSVMIARGALVNASIFRKEGMLPTEDVMMDYLQLAQQCEVPYQNVKYVFQQMIKHELNTPHGTLINTAKSYNDLTSGIRNFREKHKKVVADKAL